MPISHAVHSQKLLVGIKQWPVQRGKEQQSGWLLLLHLHNQGRQSICMWQHSSVVVSLLWYLI